MPRIIFRTRAGNEMPCDAEVGDSAMRVAINNDVPGIVGECGGVTTCGTCQVHVEKSWLARLPPAEFEEMELLEFAEDLDETSRLSCRIIVDDACDGLILHVGQNAN